MIFVLRTLRHHPRMPYHDIQFADDLISKLRPFTHNQDIFDFVCKEAYLKTVPAIWRLFYQHFKIHEEQNSKLLHEFNRRYIAYLNKQGNDTTGGSLGGDGH